MTSTTTPTTTEAPLDQPLYGATFGQAFSRFFKKYATFSGRASRSEFWWWFLASTIINSVFSLLIQLFGGYAYDPSAGSFGLTGVSVFIFVVWAIWGLATFVPWLAIIWRRLHDTNRSGGFFFLSLIPFVGWIIVLILYALESKPEGARFDR
jgi:uncharacterized membrane protein YhaH (DUF805 family)